MKDFPILWPGSENMRTMLSNLNCPHQVPWALMARHALAVHRNHLRGLDEIARRGGLTVHETASVLMDRSQYYAYERMTIDESVQVIQNAIRNHEESRSQ